MHILCIMKLHGDDCQQSQANIDWGIGLLTNIASLRGNELTMLREKYIKSETADFD